MPKISKKITIDPEDMVGVREIAERLQALGYYRVTRSHVTTWISRRDDVKDDGGKVIRAANEFPAPIKQLGMGGVYDWQHVLPWVRARYGDAPCGRRHDVIR